MCMCCASMVLAWHSMSCARRARGQHVHKGVIDGDDEDAAGIFQLGAVDVARDVGFGAGGGEGGGHTWTAIGVRRACAGKRVWACVCCLPMIRPLEVSSLARLTLLPGESSTRSTSGNLSPARTQAAGDGWKRREARVMVSSGGRRLRASSMAEKGAGGGLIVGGRAAGGRTLKFEARTHGGATGVGRSGLKGAGGRWAALGGGRDWAGVTVIATASAGIAAGWLCGLALWTGSVPPMPRRAVQHSAEIAHGGGSCLSRTDWAYSSDRLQPADLAPSG